MKCFSKSEQKSWVCYLNSNLNDLHLKTITWNAFETNLPTEGKKEKGKQEKMVVHLPFVQIHPRTGTHTMFQDNSNMYCQNRAHDVKTHVCHCTWSVANVSTLVVNCRSQMQPCTNDETAGLVAGPSWLPAISLFANLHSAHHLFPFNNGKQFDTKNTQSQFPKRYSPMLWILKGWKQSSERMAIVREKAVFPKIRFLRLPVLRFSSKFWIKEHWSLNGMRSVERISDCCDESSANQDERQFRARHFEIKKFSRILQRNPIISVFDLTMRDKLLLCRQIFITAILKIKFKQRQVWHLILGR